MKTAANNSLAPSLADLRKETNALWERNRLRCGWFLRDSFTPQTPDELRQCLKLLARHGDRATYVLARRLTKCLYPIINAPYAVCWQPRGSRAANNHGFKRARWRQLWRQKIQDYMIAAVQNVRILIRHADECPNALAQAAGNVAYTPISGISQALGAISASVSRLFARMIFACDIFAQDNQHGMTFKPLRL